MWSLDRLSSVRPSLLMGVMALRLVSLSERGLPRSKDAAAGAEIGPIRRQVSSVEEAMRQEFGAASSDSDAARRAVARYERGSAAGQV